MAENRRKPASRSALGTAVTLLLVAIPGFGLGLLAGVAWREPGLLVAHLLGRTEEVAWAAPEAPAAEPAPAPRERPEPLPPVAASPPPARPPAPAPAAEPASPASPGVTRIRPDVITPAAEPTGRFAVQVGAFSESASAERLAGSLRAKGFDTYVSPGAREGEARWRVRVGPLPTREQAERTAERLKAEERLPTWVLDEDGAV